MLLTENLKTDILKNFQSQDLDLAEQKAQFLVNKGFSDPWLCNMLAVIFAKQKKFTLASEYFKILVNLYPDNSENFFNLGNLYRDSEDNDNAIKYYKLSLEKNSKSYETLIELSKVFIKEKKIANAIFYAEKAKKIKTNLYEADGIIAQSLFSKGEFENSLKIYQGILKSCSNGDKEKITVNISSNLIELGKITEAKKLLSSLKTKQAKYNLSLIDLKNGNLIEGWNGYDNGIEVEARLIRQYDKVSKILPLWSPNKIYKSILVLGEQGLGDEIMFFPLLKNLFKNNLKVGLLMDRRLKSFFSRSLDKHDFFEDINQALKEGYESFIPIGSLCKYFLKNHDDFLHSPVYLSPDKDRVKKISKLWNSSKPKIGISWHSESLSHGPMRNIKLKKFFKIFTDINADFINLQYGDKKKEINNLNKRNNKNIFLNDEIDNKNDLEGLAAKISICDLVISIDNSTLHFAGSLNKKTFGLIPKVGDWRWMNYTNSTPWYKSITILRQSDDWEHVIGNLYNFCERKFNN